MNYRGPQTVISAPGRQRALRWHRSTATLCARRPLPRLQSFHPGRRSDHQACASMPDSARPARGAPGVGAGTFCSGVGASGHRRWRLLPRDRGWRAPAAGLPCISSEAFCPDAGARWHRRRGFLPRGRGWGAPAAMLRAPTARLFAPAAGLAGIDAVAFCLARKAPGVARKGRDVARKAPSLANGLPAPASGPATPAQRFPAQRPSPALRARRPAQDTHPALSCGPGNPACPGPRRCGAGSRRRW